MDQTPPGWSWDDEPEASENESVLDAIYFDAPEPRSNTTAQDETAESIVFTVANPPGTVSVTALPNGLPYQVTLAPGVVHMTEDELAEEISVIARLARQNALAGQHLIAFTIMTRLGLDPAAVRSELERDFGLPSPETALADKAETFTARYRFDED